VAAHVVLAAPVVAAAHVVPADPIGRSDPVTTRLFATVTRTDDLF
jgi:hypothetical protein